MTDFAVVSKHGRIGVVTIQNPPVNALSPGVPESILDAVGRCVDDDTVEAIVLIGSGRTFIAGADINELRRIAAGQAEFTDHFQRFLEQLEATPKPLVCAIHGTALGGGLETAMACHWRVADRSAIVGQPEIKLGLIPGAAGTQRLPRLIGIAMAAEMCSVGDPITADTARAYNLVDSVFDDDLLTEAVNFAERVVAESQPIHRTCDRNSHLENAVYVDAVARLRERANGERPGQLAPHLALDAVEASASLSFADGCALELERFDQCLAGGQVTAMIRAFFGQREVQHRVKLKRDGEQIEMQRILIMGKSPELQTWRQRLASASFDVRFDDQEVSVESITAELSRIDPHLVLLGLRDTSVIEFRNAAHQFARIDDGEAPICLINSLGQFEQEGEDDGNFPLPVLALPTWESSQALEIYADGDGSEPSIALVAQLAKRAGLSLIRLNRLAPSPCRLLWDSAESEAQRITEQGISAAKIADAWHRFGFVRQPVLIDLGGATDLTGAELDSIVTKCMDAMANTAVTILGEGVVDNDLAVDMLALLGLGYPPHRGGPMYSISQSGIAETLSRIHGYANEADSHWVISKHWDARIATG